MAAADTANTANTANTATTNTAEAAAPPEPQARHVIYCSGNSEIKKNIICSPILRGEKANLGPILVCTLPPEVSFLLRQRNVTQPHQSLWSEQSNPIQSNPQNNFRPKERIQQGWCQFWSLVLRIRWYSEEMQGMAWGRAQGAVRTVILRRFELNLFFLLLPPPHTHTHTHIFQPFSCGKKNFLKKKPPLLT